MVLFPHCAAPTLRLLQVEKHNLDAPFDRGAANGQAGLIDAGTQTADERVLVKSGAVTSTETLHA